MKQLLPLFVIPARGGSKGIPRKNIKPLGGRPLLAWTVDAAKEALGPACDLERIILSTDDSEIAEAGRALGLTVDYMRPAELATDTAGSREVILDVMDWADARGIDYDTVVLLQPTSPFRTSADILGACELYASSSGNPDMVVSVCESAANPYYNLFETGPDGILHVCKGSGLYTRRQDAPPVWEYNGAVYVIRPESIRRMTLGEFPVRLPYVMPRNRSLDLDTPADWMLAEAQISDIAK
ncbi:MAG: acylneuraminate cytidylyltransferase family protein [Muribaculaceae bacterium]|nr:acylneuraminate cytidylyltransferase family protein [Muribaculaceae bacterium]